MSSIPRFFVPLDAIHDGVVTLPAEAAHHALRVLRLRVGERLTIHDGHQGVYHAVLNDAFAGVVTAQVESFERSNAEPTLRITVAQALPKTPDKIEQVLQHGTEIGAAGFVVWTAQRSVARLDSGDKLEKRLARWRGIVQGAAEQSGRGVLPTVGWSENGKSLAKTFAPYDAVLTLHESAAPGSFRAALESPPTGPANLLFVVGPEGGLTHDEVAAYAAAGALTVSLGPRVLRTETAALVAVAQALYAHGG
jgi:16S rRNA (uracil1498-N3)-methyltransferase